MKRSFTLLALAAACAAFSSARADVKLPAIFSDHMLLQQDLAVPVWGWADAGEQVSVSLAGQTKTTQAGADGTWSVKLDKLAASGEAQTLSVQGKNTVTVQDVLVGEVWLCSGQSNMAMNVARAQGLRAGTGGRRVAADPHVQGIVGRGSDAARQVQRPMGGLHARERRRFFGHRLLLRSRDPQGAGPAGGPDQLVGGRHPDRILDQPGGPETPARATAALPKLGRQRGQLGPGQGSGRIREAAGGLEAGRRQGQGGGPEPPRPPRKPSEPRLDNHSPANLFNGKIAPLIPYAIRGAIWYQGESNAGEGQLYALQLPLLIRDWRARWGEGEFPFAWVQLPNFHKPQQEPVEDSGWVLVQEGMLKTLRLPNTGMAITIDVGEADNIHPTNKQAVGRRLALWALAKVYGRPGPSCGPIPCGQRIEGQQDHRLA